MIGNVDQLLHRLVHTVEAWIESDFIPERKSA
jgi:hypothetical protein